MKGIITFGLLVLTAASAPAERLKYKVVFAGAVLEVDCPESPAGQTLSWVNQNCTAARALQAPSAAAAGTIRFSADGVGVADAARPRPAGGARQ